MESSDVVDNPIKYCEVCMTPYMYVVVRSDIPIADQICQVGHACAEAGKRYQHPENTHLVLLAINNREELNALWISLLDSGVESHLYWEPDDEMGHTALASRAVYGVERKLFRQYQLWKAPEGAGSSNETAQQQPESQPSVSEVPLAHCSKFTPEREDKTRGYLWWIFSGFTSAMQKRKALNQKS